MQQPATDLEATLSQVSITPKLPAPVFTPPIRDDYEAMTLEQFRETARPLDAPTEDSRSR